MRGKLIFLGILTLSILLVTVSLIAGVRLGRFLEREADANSTAAELVEPSGLDSSNASSGTPDPAVTDNSAGVSPATAPVDISHTLQTGETLSILAELYDVPVEAIIAANGITDPNFVYAGQVLVIPGGGDENTAVSANPGELPVKPALVTVNGLPESKFIILPPGSLQNARAIFARGQNLGRSATAYAKIGDSTIENPHFMARFDGGAYNLGDYAYLQAVIDQFSGSHARDSVAVSVGMHSWTVFDPVWADKAVCFPGEAPIECEFRLQNPSLVFIRLGANDAGAPQLFAESVREIVEYAVNNGVVPIIGTKPDQIEGGNEYNDILRQIAVEYQVPLWDFDVVAGTVQGRGLDVDNVHLSAFFAHDYTLPEAYQRGHALHNLTALMLLDTIWKEVILPSQN